MKTLLPGYLLSSQGDRVALAHSIESRFPFLDHRVIEFCNAPAADLQDAGADREVPAQEEHALPAAPGHRCPDQAALPRARRRSVFSRRARPGTWRTCSRRRTSGRQATSIRRTPRSSLKKCRQGRVLGIKDNMAVVFILSTLLLHELVHQELSPTGTRSCRRENHQCTSTS